MNVKRISTTESFLELSSKWTALLSNSWSDNIFLTWEWIYTWILNYLDGNKSLFVLVVYDNGQPIGIAPWYLNQIRVGPFKIRRIEFLGTPETDSDYMDVIAKKGREKDVASELYSYLFHEIEDCWDSFLLRDIPSKSLFLMYFTNKFEDDGKYIEVRKGSYCPVLILPKTNEEFKSSLSRNRRRQQVRHFNVLNKRFTIDHETFENSVEDQRWSEFVELYKRRWNEQLHDNLIKFIERFVRIPNRKSIAKLDLLRCDQKYVTGIFFMKYNDVQYMYLMATDVNFDPSISIGNILVGLCIQNAIDDGVKTFDFLKGEESYKFHWANHAERSLNFQFYRNNPGSMLQYSIDALKNIGKIVLR